MESSEHNQNEWREKVLAGLEPLDQLPSHLVHQGPTFEVATKDGKKLSCSTVFLDLPECIDAGVEDIVKNTDYAGERYYLIAWDEAGEIAGTRITTTFDLGKKIIARSSIKIVEKGKGLARPIEEAFMQQLQTIADKHGKMVAWEISNKNLENLEDYKTSENVDPEKLKKMEEEQARWMALYGPGGKLGLDGKIKKFMPQKKDTEQKTPGVISSDVKKDINSTIQ